MLSLSKRFLTLGLVYLVIALPGKSLAQSFLVRPSILEIDGKPGTTVTGEIELSNGDAKNSREITISRCMLGQHGEGLYPVLPDKASPKELRSFVGSYRWTTVDKSNVTLQPIASTKIKITIQIPARATGFVPSALLVILHPQGVQKGTAVVVQFLVPIYLNVAGSISKPIFDLPAISLLPGAKGDEVNISTTLTNKGSGLLHGTCETILELKEGGGWKRVASTTTSSHRVIPGASFDFKATLSSGIPSGHYRARTRAVVEGNASAWKVFETDYVSKNQSVTQNVRDEVEMTPNNVDVECVSGSLRSTGIVIHNKGDRPLSLKYVIQEEIRASQAGDLSPFSASPYIHIVGDQASIAPNRSTRVNLSAALPTGAKFPTYYAKLVVQEAQADGSVLEQASALIRIHNHGVKDHADASIGAILGVHSSGDNSWNFEVPLTATGDRDLMPEETVSVMDSVGLHQVLTIEPISRIPSVHPSQEVKLKNIVNTRSLKDGAYFLKVVVKSEGLSWNRSYRFTLSTSGGKRRLKMLP